MQWEALAAFISTIQDILFSTAHDYYLVSSSPAKFTSRAPSFSQSNLIGSKRLRIRPDVLHCYKMGFLGLVRSIVFNIAVQRECLGYSSTEKRQGSDMVPPKSTADVYFYRRSNFRWTFCNFLHMRFFSSCLGSSKGAAHGKSSS